MLIGFVGDVHGRIFHALALVCEWQRRHGERFDFVVQVGDMGAFPDLSQADAATKTYLSVDPHEDEFVRLLTADGDLAAGLQHVRAELARPMHFLRGNHEDFDWLASLAVDPAVQTAAVDDLDLLRYVPDGTLMETSGITLAFLGGVEETRGDAHFDQEAYARLMRLAPGSFDILVTHEGPYGSSVGYHGDTHGSAMISELIERLRPAFCVAGHAHQLSGPSVYGETVYLGLDGLIASPRWQPEARGLQPGCLGVLDTERRTLEPVRESWLGEFETPLDFGRWTARAYSA